MLKKQVFKHTLQWVQIKTVMCFTKELYFPLLGNSLLCSEWLKQKSQNFVCESPNLSQVSENTSRCSSVTADQASKPPSSS